MYCLAAFIVIVALWSTPSVQSVDCTDQDALKMEMLKCFTQSGLSVDPDTAADVQNAIQTNTSLACSNTEAYKPAIACIMDISRTCLISSGLDPAILPDTKRMTDGIDYLCDHAADYDAECVARTQLTINRCAGLKAKAAVSVSRDRSIKFITCEVFDATLDCARQLLGVCDGRTKEIFVNYFMYTIPTACRSRKSESSGVALWSTPSVQSVDCTDQDALKMEMLKCYTQSGLSVDPDTAADVQTAIQTNTSYTCSNIEAYKLAMSCAMDIPRTCLISLRQDPAILPDTQTMTDGLHYLCDHAADYDAECVARNQLTITRCAKLKAEAAVSVSRDRSFMFGFCAVFDATLDCARKQLSVCSGRTNEIFANYFMYVVPTVCRSRKSESSGGPREAYHYRVDNVDAADGGLRLTDRTENVAWPGAQKTKSEVSGGTSAGGASCVLLLFAALLAVICRH